MDRIQIRRRPVRCLHFVNSQRVGRYHRVESIYRLVTYESVGEDVFCLQVSYSPFTS